MPTEVAGSPLRRAEFSSTDADEVTDYIERMYVGNKTTFGVVRGRAGFTAHYVDSGPIATDRVRCSIDYHGWTEPWDFFCSLVLDHGWARMESNAGEVRLRPGDSMVYPLGLTIEFDLGDVGARVVRMPMASLDQAAELLGVAAGQLRIDGTRPVSPAMARYWRYHVGLVNGSLSDDRSPMTSVLLREELARLTALAALHVFPNTTMSQSHVNGPGTVAPAAVRRAVDYIDAHADSPLTLADIAAAAGIGIRAVQYAFRRHLDTTPLAYLRRVRLEHAHRELRAADPQRGDTVEAIAAKWGFGNPSRFAAEHRGAYGELPSRTLRR